MKQLFFHLVPVLAFGLVLAACDNDSDEWTQPYEFAWSYGAESQFSVGKPATFTDLSLGVETREWSFEDATPATSTDPEPSVVFNSKGIKTVTLTIHFLNGQVQSESFDIEVFYPLSARIKALELTPKGCIRLDTPVSFGLTEVEGNPTSYQWTFEGGTPSSSTDPAPVVTWTSANKNGARISCRLTRADDGMTTTVEQTFIVGNYPMLHPIPEKDYDPWRFELSSIGKWTLWNTTTSADDLTTNTSIVSGGADGSKQALKVTLKPGVIYQLFTRDNWVCNAQLVAGQKYEVSFWQKTDAAEGSLIVLTGIYNNLPSWSWNEYLQVLASDHWSIYFPDIPFEEQVEEMFGIWSNIEYPLTETITLPASPELMPSAEWKQVRFEFTATSAKYESLLNTYPQFALLSAGSADVILSKNNPNKLFAMKRFVFLLAGLLLIASSLRAQTSVSGTITSPDGKPVAGASIIIEGSTVGATSDAKGFYRIKVRSSKDILVFNFLGYREVRESVGQRSLIDVVLSPSDLQIDDVVVVGYGALRKKDMTGAVASIKADAFENRVLFSVDDALAGGVAGLMVNSSSGKPGSESSMLIRGANSLTGSTAPLIVLDGFPLFDVSTSTGGGIDGYDTGMSSLSMINPDDIASIEVLKDASATAIYGNRGANGVILITTKRGRGDSGKIQYNTYFGFQQMNKRYDMMDFRQYAAYQVDRNSSNNHLFTDPITMQPRTIGDVQSRDWQDEIFRTGFIQNHSLSISHSTEKTSMFVSGSYMQNKSVLIATNWQKLTAKATIDHRFTDFIRTGVDIGYNRIVDDGVPTGGEGTSQVAGVITSALTALPFEFDETTQAYFRRAGVSQSSLDSYIDNYHGNPVNIANETELTKRINRMMLNAYVEADILKNLTLRITAGYDSYSLKDRQFYPTSTPRGYFYKGQGIIGSSESGSWINENTLTWKPVFGKHRLNVLVGMTEQGYTNFYDRSETTQYEYEDLGSNNAQMAKVFNVYSSKEQVRYVSLIGRINYSYDNRYIATFTLRRDATSRFINDKWGTFLSGALAWNIDSERFMQNQNTVSALKLRLSLGEVGNSNVPTSGSYSQLYGTNYSFGTIETIGQSSLSIANENLSWETTREVNAGLEVGLWNDRLKFTADFYDKVTRDLLLEAPVVNIVGFDKAWQNIGKMRNRGIELSLNAQLINHKNFKWNFFANFARNKTKILELGQSGAPILLGVTCLSGQNAVILQEGGEIGDIYGYVTKGVYGLNDFEIDGITPKPDVAVETGAEKPGAMRFADLYKDEKITSDDRTVIGNSTPDFFGAFGTNFTWKNLDLNLSFQYSYGGNVYNANYNQLAAFTGTTNNQMAFFEERWSPRNLASTQYSTMTNGAVCSAFVEDASFLRLRSARISYTCPRKWFGPNSHIGSIKFYIAGENLFVLTRYSGYDPEVYSNQGSSSMSNILTSGFDYGCFPRPRTFTAGINILFQ